LWNETGETNPPCGTRRGDVIYIDKTGKPEKACDFFLRRQKGPAYCTGVGKAMMAFLSEDLCSEAIKRTKFYQAQQKRLIDDYAKKSIIDIRESKISLDLEEHEKAYHARLPSF